MDFLKISQNKLKISLCPEEMAEWGLEKADPSPPSRERIRRLLSLADSRVGFDTRQARILLQLFASRDGGCELFVSKIGPLPSLERPSALVQRLDAVFRFERLDWLLSACGRLLLSGYGGDSQVFRYRGAYYLLLQLPSDFDPLIPDRCSFLGEYASALPFEVLRPLLWEHGLPICTELAVERLGPL